MTRTFIHCADCGDPVKCLGELDEYGDMHLDEVPEACPHCGGFPINNAYLAPSEDFHSDG